MTYKIITVYADLDSGAPSRLALAARLAARFDAHLIGLHVIRAPALPAFVAAEAPAALAESQQALLRARADQSGVRLADAARAEGAPSHAFRAITDPMGDMLGAAVRAVRTANLIIAPQANADDDDPALSQLAEKLVMESGRPVLITPYSGMAQAMPRHPVVLWNGAREAARAVFDALPLLQAAERVTILSVDPDQSEETGDGPLPGADLAQTLARHDVRVGAQTAFRDRGDVGEALLSQVADIGGDLIVMGAYGHPRLREMFFGGATRTIFRSMTAPVLAAH